MKKFSVLFLYEFLSIITGRWLWFLLIVYNLLFALVRYYTVDRTQIFISSTNIVIYFNSIAVLLFSTLYWQNNSEFVSLILTQPVKRSVVFLARLFSFYSGLILVTALTVLVHLVQVLDLHFLGALLLSQVLIQFIFIGVGFFLAILTADRLKALAWDILLIVFFVFILDGIILWLIINYSQYPLEKVVLLLSSLNPISLMKFQTLSDVNVSLWSGYSGILLKRAYESGFIQAMNILSVILWWALPTTLAAYFFNKKDF